MATLVLVLDQASKAIVRVLWSEPATQHPLDLIVSRFAEPLFRPTESLPLIGESLRLTHVRNMGAAFGMFPGYQPLFIATSLIVLVVVAAYWRRAHPAEWPVVVALGLVSGGAVGNLIDRALLGKVTDFFDVAIIDFPVFNIADTAIFVGVGMLVFWLLFGPQGAVEADPPALVAEDALSPTDEAAAEGETSR